MHRVLKSLAILLVLVAPAAAGVAAILPPPGYVFAPAPGCEKAARPPAIYDVCADQMALFTQARTEAFAAKKTLFVILGATWCPSCKSLKIALPSAEVLGRVINGQALSERVHVVEIAISTLAGGKVAAVPSGEAVWAGLRAARPDFKQRTIPFIVAIDPVSGRASARNLDDLEASGGGWNRAALATVIAEADAEARGGPKAAGEPGWLMRKWRRWFGA